MADAGNREGGPRVPTREDVLRIAQSLNAEQARYIIIGGFAVYYHGFARTTQDIDLLVDPAPENIDRIRRALAAILPDKAALEVRPNDVLEYSVVRIADEVVIDLLADACGVRYEEVQTEVEWADVDGIKLPFLSPRALLKTKQTYREKDTRDRLFLEQLLAEEEKGA